MIFLQVNISCISKNKFKLQTILPRKMRQQLLLTVLQTRFTSGQAVLTLPVFLRFHGSLRPGFALSKLDWSPEKPVSVHPVVPLCVARPVCLVESNKNHAEEKTPVPQPRSLSQPAPFWILEDPGGSDVECVSFFVDKRVDHIRGFDCNYIA